MKRKKQILAVLLAIVTIIAMMPVMNGKAAQNDTEETNNSIQNGTNAISSILAWSDDWVLTNHSYEYSHDLAIAGAVLAGMAYTGEVATKAALVQIGCNPKEIVANYNLDYTNEDAGGVNQAAYAIARKKVSTENGNKEILYVVIRGTASAQEWMSNVNISDTTKKAEMYHEGFDIVRKQILTEITKYAMQYGMDLPNTSVYIVGHSRGAAIANLLGASLNQVAQQGSLGLAADKIFTYTYATPNTTTDPTASSELYNNIYNIINPEDLVTMLPLAQWGYTRYGIDKVFYSSSFAGAAEYQQKYAWMNTYFKMLNQRDYANMEGGIILNAKLSQAITKSMAATVEQYYTKLPFSLHDLIIQALGQQTTNTLTDELEEETRRTFADLQEETNTEGLAVKLIQLLYQLCGIQFNGTESLSDMHLPQTYLAWLMSGEQNCFYNGTAKSLAVSGATDFVLTDTTGTVMLQMTDGAIDINNTDKTYYPIIDRTGTVYFTVPITEDYQLAIHAPADTAVNVTAEHYNQKMQVDNQRVVTENSLKAGEELILTIPAGEDLSIIEEEKPELQGGIHYSTHVQNIGWMDAVSDGQLSGTTGQNLRLEGIRIHFDESLGTGDVEYRTHVSNLGWGNWNRNGETSGTTGQSLRLEAIQIRLTGELAEKYDIYYAVHIQNKGWMNWAKNGAAAGSQGQSLRLEGIRIQLVEKGSSAPEPINSKNRTAFSAVHLVGYETYVQNLKWQNEVYDGTMGGTTGQNLRLEAIRIRTVGNAYTGTIQYRTHIQNLGWEKEFKNANEISGTRGKSLRLEGIQIRLTEELAQYYDVYYRVHVQNEGWQAWVKNGETAGTTGKSLRLEGIRIVLVEKGEQPPV